MMSNAKTNRGKTKTSKASIGRGKKPKDAPAPHYLNHIHKAINELDGAMKECRMASDCNYCQSKFLCHDMTLRAREFLEALPGLVARH